MTHQSPFASNGGVRRSRSDVVHRSDVANWRSSAAPVRTGYQSHVSSNSSSPPSSGRHPSSAADEDEFHAAGNRGGAHDNLLHGRLLFLTMCLVGQFVDVHLKDGSVYSGIFHTANVDKDFGVVLKMAKLTKEAAGKGGKNDSVKQQLTRRPPMKLLIIYAKDLDQIAAKEVLLTGESIPNVRSKENRNELLTDSVISQNRRETERELKPWKPDSDAPRNLDLESTFQNSSHRSWDQFQTNKVLFGVESTFNEELYTTKLERGPQTRDREREALRLAREIENETLKSQPMEDRFGPDADLDNLDEETRYSSVLRSNYDDTGDDGTHSKNDELNEETFGSASVASETGAPGAASDSSSPPHDLAGSPRSSVSAGDTAAAVPIAAPASTELPRESKVLESARKGRKDLLSDLKQFAESPKEQRSVKNPEARLPKAPSTVAKLAEAVKSVDIKPSTDAPSKQIQPSISPPPASALPLPGVLNPAPSTASSGSSSSRAPVKPAASPPPALSRSSSSSLDASREDAEAPQASTSSPSPAAGGAAKKFSLNPNAKEFKLNPNAKAFTPLGGSAQRPASPVNQQSSMYVPTQVPLQMPVGMGYVQQQPGQPAQFAQYNNTIAATGVTAAPFIQPSPFVPAATVPPLKLPPQTQPQANAAPYGQQQLRYMPPMQQAPAYPHPNYPQQVIYGHQGPYLYFHQYPQPMMQPQPVMPIPQQPSAQHSQPQRGDPSVLAAQSPVQSPLPSPVHRPQPAAGGGGGGAAQHSSGNASKPATNGGPRGNKA